MNGDPHADRTSRDSVNAAAVGQRVKRQHVVWAITAATVSILVHVALITLFPGFDLAGFVKDHLPDAKRPLHLKDVRVEPEPEAAALRPPRFRPDSREMTGPGTGAGRDDRVLRRPLDETAVEPRDPGPGILIGEQTAVREPALAERPLVQPREEILRIEDRVVKDSVSALPRRYTPRLQRLSGAADIVQPADRSAVAGGAGDATAWGTLGEPSRFQWGRPAAGGGRDGGLPPPPVTPAPVPSVPDARDLARANLKRLDKLLRAEVRAYQSMTEPAYAYCRIAIARRGDDVLPVLPKDVLLVQDASASITEQKLHFCREGLLKALDQLGPDDRFNVVEFRDKTHYCFPGWSPVNPDMLDRAREFIGQMAAEGNTDIFDSLKDLLDLPREAGRPVVMQVISDGVATVGLTDRSLIIEAFSQLNRGRTSVFTLGTYPGVNAYLLDLLSYRNRGDTQVVKTGRWDIPTVIEARMREVARPVLSDVQFRFAGQASVQVLPRLTQNLYLDRPLVLFVRYPRDESRLVFQATGQAGDTSCDMVFDLDLAAAEPGDREIRTQWAWQKLYDLIGEHNRTHRAAVLDEMRVLGKTYGIRVPYRNELRD